MIILSSICLWNSWKTSLRGLSWIIFLRGTLLKLWVSIEMRFYPMKLSFGSIFSIRMHRVILCHGKLFFTPDSLFLVEVWNSNLCPSRGKLWLSYHSSFCTSCRTALCFFLVSSNEISVLRFSSSAKSVVGAILRLNLSPSLQSSFLCETLPWITRLDSQSILEW